MMRGPGYSVNVLRAGTVVYCARLGKSMSEIFVSYSRSDSDFVDKLIGELEQSGLHVWVDREDIGGGDRWRASISEAIRGAKP